MELQPAGMDGTTRALALTQGAFYVGTGVWPLLHLRSFEAVTGPKLEGWLVKTVGALVTVVGAAVLLAARARRTTPELALVAGGSALALAVVDVVYVTRGRIAPVYLLDALPEVVLAGGWMRALLKAPAARVAPVTAAAS